MDWNWDTAPVEDGAARARRMEAIGVPARIARVLESFRDTEAVDLVRAWLATPSCLLVLSGTVGSGKSVAAAWALANNIRRTMLKLIGLDPVESVERLSGRWVSAADLVEASDFDGDFWGPLRRAHLLVIDEAGPERLDAKGRALGNFSGLLRRRYDDSRRTIVTTNLRPAEWLRIYGEGDGGRLRDRLREAETEFGRSALVSVTGRSLRGEAEGSAP
jgi:hypothetical protein